MTSLTVYFDGQFWVGVFERSDGGRYAVAKIVFGAEPSDAEILDFTLKRYHSLVFSEPLQQAEAQQKKVNPKRMARLVRKASQQQGIGTKAQQAFKAEQERLKEQRSAERKKRREITEMERFALRQEKKKEKKKGH
jgi:hypothetical protein